MLCCKTRQDIQKGMLIYMLPPKLKKGDTIGIFSSSYPITALAPKATQRAACFLEKQGYRIIMGELSGKQDCYRSGSIPQRAHELNALIENPDVKCIMSAIGGMVTNAILPYLNFATLQKHPKIIVGYSDTTALLLGTYEKTELVTFYGPSLLGSFAEYPPYNQLSLQYFEAVTSGKSSFPLLLPTPEIWSEEAVEYEKLDRPKRGKPNRLLTIHPGKAQGRLIGGNLNAMTGVWGSPYMPEIRDGDILLIEDSQKDIALLERLFSMLKLNGIFDRIGGLILGKHDLLDDRGTGKACYDMLLEVMGKPKIPVLAEFDCCHTKPMLTMPIGAQIELDAGSQTVTLLNPCVC